MNPILEHQQLESRRYFLQRAAAGMGTAALASLLNPGARASAATASPVQLADHGILEKPHFTPRAKRIIYLVMNEGPSQLDMLDYKPQMIDMYDKDLPDSVRGGQRITTMTSGQARFPIAPSIYKFSRHGQNGTWFSELLPHTATVADDITVIKSMHTEAINHDPAITYIQTGSQLPGRPSAGAWVAYGLGRINENLPTYIVLHSSWSSKRDAQALYSRLWGSGFIPSKYQGVSLRSSGDPVLYLSNPDGVNSKTRRTMLDALAKLNQKQLEAQGDPEIATRISQYEMAFRMQSSVPELVDFSDEPKHVLDMYGPDVHKPGTFASNCLLARRLAQRDVRFIQVFIRGWDQHGDLTGDLPLMCKDVDQGQAALIKDLKQHGLLDDTLVIWGGEFGRSIYSQGTLTKTNYGRDHHPRNFCMWMAGAGIKSGTTYGETDDFSYNVVEKPVHIHDLNATMLYCLGIDHEKLTYRFQGRDYRLTDVHGTVVRDLFV